MLQHFQNYRMGDYPLMLGLITKGLNQAVGVALSL